MKPSADSTNLVKTCWDLTLHQFLAPQKWGAPFCPINHHRSHRNCHKLGMKFHHFRTYPILIFCLHWFHTLFISHEISHLDLFRSSILAVHRPQPDRHLPQRPNWANCASRRDLNGKGPGFWGLIGGAPWHTELLRMSPGGLCDSNKSALWLCQNSYWKWPERFRGFSHDNMVDLSSSLCKRSWMILREIHDRLLQFQGAHTNIISSRQVYTALFFLTTKRPEIWILHQELRRLSCVLLRKLKSPCFTATLW